MSQDTPNDPKSTSPDDLTKTTPKSNVELKDAELDKAAGGTEYLPFILKDVTISKT